MLITWIKAFLHSELITNQKTAFLTYIKSLDCYLDILAVLPLEIFALIWAPSGEHMNYVAMFRINRLLKLWKVMDNDLPHCMHAIHPCLWCYTLSLSLVTCREFYFVGSIRDKPKMSFCLDCFSHVIHNAKLSIISVHAGDEVLRSSGELPLHIHLSGHGVQVHSLHPHSHSPLCLYLVCAGLLLSGWVSNCHCLYLLYVEVSL